MKVIDAWREAEYSLHEAKIGSYQLDARVLLAHILGHSEAWLLAHGDESIAETKLAELRELTARRAEREPLAYIVGRREFYGLPFITSPDALIPRVETEVMVENIVKSASKGATMIDVGTGCGAIALAVAHARTDMHVIGTDISEPALTLARRNAEELGVDLDFSQADLLAGVEGTFDVIAANLPYVATTKTQELAPELSHEPDVALYGGSDGLNHYRTFFTQISSHLRPGGFVYCEADPWQHEALIALAAREGLTQILSDYFIIGFQLPQV